MRGVGNIPRKRKITESDTGGVLELDIHKRSSKSLANLLARDSKIYYANSKVEERNEMETEEITKLLSDVNEEDETQHVYATRISTTVEGKTSHARNVSHGLLGSLSLFLFPPKGPTGI